MSKTKSTTIVTTMEDGGKRVPKAYISRPTVGKSIAEKKGPYKSSRYGEGVYEELNYKKPR